MSETPVVIQRLEVSNFKKVTAVTITPQGKVVTLRGKNAAGKSSVLDAIEAALHGGDAIPDAPVNGSSARSEIKLDLGSFIVEREIRPDRKHTLKITSTNPRQVSTQAWLNERLGARSFDTSTFLRMKPKEQSEALRRALGIDTAGLDADAKAAFEERTNVNREVERLKGAITQTPAPNGPDEPVDVAALMDELAQMGAVIAENERLRTAEQVAARKVEEASEALAVAKAAHDAAIAAMPATLSDPDPTPIESKLRDSQAINEAVAQRKRRAELLEQQAQASAKAKALTEKLEEIAAAKEALLASSSFPIPNLKLVDDEIYLNGQPISQASQAERLRFQVALWLEDNPGVRVMLLREASLLDADSLATIGKMVGDAGGQVWMEVVGTEGDGILIEDGAIVEHEVTS